MRKKQFLTSLLAGVVLLPLLIPARPAASHGLTHAPAAAPGFLLAASPAPTPFPKPSENVFPANYFAPTAQRRTVFPKPFTVAEVAETLKKFAPDKIINISGRGTVVAVKRKPSPSKPGGLKFDLVTLNKYVEQLNQYESYLNGLGYTLRDGVYGGAKTMTKVESNMGDILRLRPWKEVHPKEEKCPPPGLNCPPEFVAYDPDPFSFLDPKKVFEKRGRWFRHDTSRIRLVRSQRASVPFETASRFGAATVDAELRATVPDRLGRESFKNINVKLIPLPPNPLTHRTRVMMLGPFDELGNAITSGVLGMTCEMARSMGLDVPGCGTGDKPPAPKGTEGGGGASVDPKDAPAPGDPKCLYNPDGVMHRTLAPAWFADATATDGNGWFEASASSILNMAADQQGASLGIRHWGRTSVGATVLGIDFTFAEYTRETKYDSTASAKFSAPKNKFVAVLPVIGEIPIDGQLERHIEGPGATFMVGPVPITVESGLNARIGTASGVEAPVQPPLACGTNGTGRVDLFLGANARADLTLSAKLDAFVASAGVEASLVLMDDTIGSRLISEIAPDANTIKVTPAITYSRRHLAGAIRLFVEVDLVVYTKKWSVVLLDSEGIVRPSKTVPDPPVVHTFASKKKL